MIPAVLGLASGTILLLSREEEPAPPLPGSMETMKAPLGLSQASWMAFLRAAACGTPKTISPSFRLGVFGMTVRRLCDLGAMADPRVTHYQGRQVWDAEWVEPVSLRAFQAAPLTQYRLFCESISRYQAAEEVILSVGKIIDGHKVTRSGALMVAHRAGLPGMCSWMTDEADRKKFSDNTTAFFLKANGIF